MASATRDGFDIVNEHKDKTRFLAGGVSGILVAVLFNPLDVIKTRMQAEAAAASTSGRRPCTPQPVRGAVSRVAFPSLAGCCCDPSGAVYMARPCAYPSAQPSSGASMWRTGMDILAKERLSALWRGVDSALLVSVPMIGLYLPLYDTLLAQTTPAIGVPYGAMLSGVVARGAVSFLVAPLELVRTKQQAVVTSSSSAAFSTSGRSSTVSAMRDILSDVATASTMGRTAATGQAAPSSNQSSGGFVGRSGGSGLSAAALTRTLPRLWTGFSATLARDMPFSAVYWGMLEPMRKALFAASSRARAHQAVPWGADPPAPGFKRHPPPLVDGASDEIGSRQRAAVATSSARHDGDSQSTHVDSAHSSDASASPLSSGHHPAPSSPPASSVDKRSDAASSQPASPLAEHWSTASTSPAPTLAPASSARWSPAAASPHASLSAERWEVVRVNLVAGSVSGGVAAAVTTPFDVIKTALQLADLKAQRRQGALDLVQQVWQQQGLRGFFTGAAPRAARAAPACAIVVSSYELLKMWL